MKKPVFYTEIAFVVSLLLLALGTALMVRGDFGVSMVTAPAYVLHLKISQVFPFYTFGVAEYSTQMLALLLMVLLVRRLKFGYLLTFATAIVYGGLMDTAITVINLIPADGVLMRVALYIPGLLICSAAIALILRSYFPPAAYELFVKETSAKWKKPLKTVKTVYDCVSLVIAVALSLIFFGKLEGVGVGTVVSAFVNGTLIHLFGRLYDRLFTFTDRFPLRRYFEEREDSV